METRKPGPPDINVTLLAFGAWTIRQPGITFALAGVHNSAQVLENIGAENFKLSDDEIKKINSLSSELILDRNL